MRRHSGLNSFECKVVKESSRGQGMNCLEMTTFKTSAILTGMGVQVGTCLIQFV